MVIFCNFAKNVEFMAIFNDLCFGCTPPSPKPPVKRCKGGGGFVCNVNNVQPHKVNYEKDIVRGRGHQNRLSSSVVKQVATVLAKKTWHDAHYKSFEEFYIKVRSIVNIHGIGNLTVYDIATQLIKCFPTLAPMPCDYVYLASGALDGARILLGSKTVTAELKKAKAHLQRIVATAGYAGNNLYNINRNLGAGVCLHRSVFDAYFPSSVSAYDIEDILCIYKKHFTPGGTKQGCCFTDIAAIVAHYKPTNAVPAASISPQQVNP
ncbi:MAG: hypothetical protein E7087_03435 [Bacteroidales bacterium]|nr:hypothetical protein [Bacteroidales bacterium]